MTAPLQLEVSTDRMSYRAGAAVVLNIALTNSGATPIPFSRQDSSETIYIPFLERGGRGTFALRFAAVFGDTFTLAAGERRARAVELRRRDVSERTAVLHYELPERTRVFQVFVPVPGGALSVNLPGVEVGDGWATEPRGLAAVLAWMRDLFGRR